MLWSFQYISIALNLPYNQNKLYNKGLGIVSLQYFVYEFARKYFSCHILLTGQISLSDWSLLFEILGNMDIAIVYFAGCGTINFEIDLVFPLKPFFYISKKLRQ